MSDYEPTEEESIEEQKARQARRITHEVRIMIASIDPDDRDYQDAAASVLAKYMKDGYVISGQSQFEFVFTWTLTRRVMPDGRILGLTEDR